MEQHPAYCHEFKKWLLKLLIPTGCALCKNVCCGG